MSDWVSERVLDLLGAVVSKGLHRTIDLETSIGEFTLVTAADELISLIHVSGSYDQASPEDIALQVESLEQSLILLCHISDSRRRQAAKASCLRRCRS